MALQTIMLPDGTTEVVHITPHNRVDPTITAPSYDAVLTALAVLKATANETQEAALNVIESFFKTR